MNTHPLIRICPVCQKRFLKQRKIDCNNGKYKRIWETRQKYCSPACRQKAYRQRNWKRLHAPKPAYPLDA